MEKGVCTKGRFRARKSFFVVLAVVLVLLLAEGVVATLLTPQNIELEDFSSTQEQVITIINDQFEPIACEMHLDYLSTYLQDFIVFEPERYILQPGEQKNVKVVTSFPSNLSPQTHKVIIHASRANDGNSTISFRPPGKKQSKLTISNILENSSSNEASEDIIVSLQLENEGNTVLFVTPTLEIRQNNNHIKEIVYPQPLIILAGTSYPLTLRQDSSELEEGTYQITIKALYADNEEEFFSEEHTLSYTLSRAVLNNTGSSQRRNIIIGLLVGALGAISIIWFKPLFKQRHKHEEYNQRQHKVITSSSSIKDIRHEVHVLKQEVSSLTKEVSAVVERSEQINNNRNR